jgi:hypothetical protein
MNGRLSDLNTVKGDEQMKNILKTAATTAMGLALTACALMGGKGSKNASEIPMVVNNKLPSVEGQVSIRNEENNNTGIDLSVKHLARPERVSPDATTYMVWGKPAGDENAQALPLGALNVDEDLNAEIKTVTPLKNFDLFITAEPAGVTNEPTGERLLWALINR